MTIPTRDRKGRYSYRGKWQRLCVCGHTLGMHTAAAPHSCIIGDFKPTGCDCQKFRLSRKVTR